MVVLCAYLIEIPPHYYPVAGRFSTGCTKSDGMGMGLSICRAIIEAHEGRLWVSPNIPHGTGFQFTLRGDVAASAGA